MQSSLALGDVIGSGVSGVVYKGRYNNQTAAIKRFLLRGHTVDDSEIEREIDQLKSLHSRFIIQYHAVQCQDREILLITDYADGGSLRQAIDDSRIIDWGQKERIAQEIAAGLAYIHQESILHRDLRSDNVLLTRHMDVKLCDFGLATIKKSSEDPSKDPLRSTLLWMAPELVLAGRPLYSSKSDMYALGMVMWEMAAMCTTPFKDVSSQHAAATAVYCGKREQLPGDTPSEYRGWVDLCWKQDPSERPEAIKVKIGANVLSVKPGTGTVKANSDIRAGSHGALDDIVIWVDPPEAGRRDWALSRFRMTPRVGTMAIVLVLMYLHALFFHQDYPQQTASVCMATELEGTTEQSNLSTLLSKGGHLKQSDAGVARWLTNPANRLLAMAQNRAGILYESGQYVEQSHVEAVKWFIKAADRGSLEAQTNLGLMYTHGQGVEQNDAEAYKWFVKAACQGQPASQSNLGWMYATGRYVQQNATMAVKWYTMAASQEFSEAQRSLGLMYWLGQDVVQSDLEAVRWFTKAASQGNSYAQHNLGFMYAHGRGVEQSDTEAVRWYVKAASQGISESQFYLGLMYSTGRGVEQSDVEAVRWYTKAASQGNSGAQNNLGLMYKNGR
ncbi:hypothetical protein DFQ26_001006, partial [Actinomortierella ambigua]